MEIKELKKYSKMSFEIIRKINLYNCNIEHLFLLNDTLSNNDISILKKDIEDLNYLTSRALEELKELEKENNG